MEAVWKLTTEIQSCTPLATNSGPLSERTWLGAPRRRNSSESASNTSVALSLLATRPESLSDAPRALVTRERLREHSFEKRSGQLARASSLLHSFGSESDRATSRTIHGVFTAAWAFYIVEPLEGQESTL